MVRKDISWTITDAFVPTTEGTLDSNIVKNVYTDFYEPSIEVEDT